MFICCQTAAVMSYGVWCAAAGVYTVYSYIMLVNGSHCLFESGLLGLASYPEITLTPKMSHFSLYTSFLMYH